MPIPKEIFKQIPLTFTEPIEQEDDPGGDEAQVQGVYGPKFHLLTEQLVQELAPTFPRKYYVLEGQEYWMSPIGKRARSNLIEEVTFLVYDPDSEEPLMTYSDKYGYLPIFEDNGRMVTGTGNDPMYIYLPSGSE